jgi:copper(I)-binding protein
MKYLFLFLTVSILTLTACSPATGIRVSKAWARHTARGETGAVYFLLENHSAKAEELTGVSSDVADVVEMHQTTMDGDIMRMRQVMSVPIEAKGSVEFAPGGYHAMLVEIKRDLNLGDEIQITWHFSDHQDITMNIPVQELDGGFMNGH